MEAQEMQVVAHNIMAEYTVWNVSYWYSRWSVANENTEVKELAESVAKDLGDKLGDSMKDYFDRFVNGDDDYSLIVYDYRDNDKVQYSNSYKRNVQAWEDSVTEITKIYKEKFLISAGSVTFKEEMWLYTDTTKENNNPKPQADPGDITIQSMYDPDSVSLVDFAIDKVSRARSSMGAIRNRHEHAYNNNANTSENTQAAESRLRDTDMAEEMMEYSKNNILE